MLPGNDGRDPLRVESESLDVDVHGIVITS